MVFGFLPSTVVSNLLSLNFTYSMNVAPKLPNSKSQAKRETNLSQQRRGVRHATPAAFLSQERLVGCTGTQQDNGLAWLCHWWRGMFFLWGIMGGQETWCSISKNVVVLSWVVDIYIYIYINMYSMWLVTNDSLRYTILLWQALESR